MIVHRVVMPDSGCVSWAVLGEHGVPLEPVESYLAYLAALEQSPNTRQQATVNRTLIARADSNGQFRLADNLRRVQDSLERIIPALEQLDGQPKI